MILIGEEHKMNEMILRKTINEIGAKLANAQIDASLEKAHYENAIEELNTKLADYEKVLNSDETLAALFNEQREKLEVENV